MRTPIACLEDNYAYLLDDGSGELAVVDVREAGAGSRRARPGQGQRSPRSSSTHHHHDHVAATTRLPTQHPGVSHLRLRELSRAHSWADRVLEDGETFNWGKSEVRALHIPGHTTGAVAYVVDDAVFTGDTLFLAGCGRLFEGTPAMMHRSLNDVLVPLGAEMRVFCGHEYTVE